MKIIYFLLLSFMACNTVSTKTVLVDKIKEQNLVIQKLKHEADSIQLNMTDADYMDSVKSRITMHKLVEIDFKTKAAQNVINSLELELKKY